MVPVAVAVYSQDKQRCSMRKRNNSGGRLNESGAAVLVRQPLGSQSDPGLTGTVGKNENTNLASCGSETLPVTCNGRASFIEKGKQHPHAMNLSQYLDDSPMRSGAKPTGGEDPNLQEVYNERHRLALEELLSGGLDTFMDFIGKERIPNFLSDDEMQRIRSAAVPARCASLHAGEDQTLEQSVGSSMDCSSVTYFPEVSDVEPPLLEIGWPGFTAGSYRGVTRAVAHFQPSYGDCIYSCKEAARRMIKSARESRDQRSGDVASVGISLPREEPLIVDQDSGHTVTQEIKSLKM
ncbi:Protein FAM83D [Liparis tanakae]|uniref:Protein FAM83D n=1 Tax=Liparis tanakae TaxID=230148 RepID=A0A4Z2GHA0_9TELE|nr:Protein FAM83D [Liparis tanakae]